MGYGYMKVYERSFTERRVSLRNLLPLVDVDFRVLRESSDYHLRALPRRLSSLPFSTQYSPFYRFYISLSVLRPRGWPGTYGMRCIISHTGFRRSFSSTKITIDRAIHLPQSSTSTAPPPRSQARSGSPSRNPACSHPSAPFANQKHENNLPVSFFLAQSLRGHLKRHAPDVVHHAPWLLPFSR